MVEDEPDHVRIAIRRSWQRTIYVGHGVSAAPDAVVWAAVRPEKIQLSVEPPQQTDNVTRGVVKEIAYMGDMSVYLVQLDSGKMMRVTQPNAYRHADDHHLGRAGVAELARVQPGGADRMSARAEVPHPQRR